MNERKLNQEAKKLLADFINQEGFGFQCPWTDALAERLDTGQYTMDDLKTWRSELEREGRIRKLLTGSRFD